MNRRVILRKVSTWFSARTKNEKLLLGVTTAFIVCFTLIQTVGSVFDYIDENKRFIQIRKTQLVQTMNLLNKFHELNTRLTTLQTTFAELQLSFEEVIVEVDRVVKESIGSATYSPPTRVGEAQPLGNEFERQDYRLKIQALTLDQLVKLLYNLERGKTPLFLGKVVLTKDLYKPGEFKADLEFTSVGRKRSATSPTSAEG